MRPLQARDGFGFVVWSAWLDQRAIRDWLASTGGVDVRPVPGTALVVCTHRNRPDVWARLFDQVEVRHLTVDPERSLAMVVVGTREQVARLVLDESLVAGGTVFGPVAPRRAVLTGAPDVLTGRQREALSEAVLQGYFEVPHGVTLRDLAKAQDMSVAALSELLRRAQARLVYAYMSGELAAGAEHGADADRQAPATTPDDLAGFAHRLVAGRGRPHSGT